MLPAIPFRLIALSGALLAAGLTHHFTRTSPQAASSVPDSTGAATVSISPPHRRATVSESPARVSPEHAATAAINPDRAAHIFSTAFSTAQREPDAALREQKLLAALTEWAGVDVAAAGGWLVANPEALPPDLALAALFEGAKSRPEPAVAYAQDLALQFPERAADIGSCLVAALGRAGEHPRAARFAAATDAQQHPGLLTAAYHGWGRHQPQEALLSTRALAHADQRRAAFHAVVAGWAKTDPSALAQYAASALGGDERTFALVTALRQWAAKSPEEAAQFLTKTAGPLPGAELILED